ncbi:10662_t:CDS:2 [Ambispora leptoticha]|uniref:Pre-mRNA-splicing factor CWC24 n=1 Tax=Ambispora leptoticha TaxID=144679 RepID=A0A9N9AK08_9GLOM|nr:10662_t:CDS:2 [Ambispora leptoticha]
MSKEKNNEKLTLIEETSNVPFFKKKNKINKNIRKRQRDKSDDGSDNEETNSTVVRKERKLEASPFIQETKREKRVTTEDISVTYASNKSAASSMPHDVATRTAEWDTAADKDAQALLEKKLAAEEAEDDNLYKGQHAYKSYIKKRDTAAGSAASSKIKAGPIRAPANIRVTSRFDYQPDICKDYKETGFCGYGDSCKFLHDRGDYKTGWQLEREWEEKQGKLGRDPNTYIVESSDEDSDNELPFACLICRQEYSSPIVTRCGHYFCEKCAIKNFAKDPKCFACGAPTNGIFNAAKNLLQKLKEKKKRYEEKEQEKQQPPSREVNSDSKDNSDEDDDESD